MKILYFIRWILIARQRHVLHLEMKIVIFHISTRSFGVDEIECNFNSSASSTIFVRCSISSLISLINFLSSSRDLPNRHNNLHAVEEGTSDKISDIKANKGSGSNFLEGQNAHDIVKCD